MKKIFFVMICFAQVACADWKLNAIYNESDLQLDGAYRLKEGGKRKPTYLDKKIKAAQIKPVIMIDYKTLTKADTQGYLCISLHDIDGEKYELFFDSQPAHSLKWHRTKTIKFVKDEDLYDQLDDNSLYARVFLKYQGNNVAHVRFSYDGQDVMQLDLIIRGKDGQYTLELGEPLQ